MPVMHRIANLNRQNQRCLRYLRMSVVAVACLLSMGISRCVTQPASIDCRSELDLTVDQGQTMTFNNVCGDNLWVSGDNFELDAAPDGVKVVTSAGPTRELSVARGVQPGKLQIGYTYSHDSSWGAGTMNLTIVSPLQLTVSASPNIINAGQSSALKATVTGGAPPISYSWSPSAGLSSTTVAEPTAAPSTTTRYTVTGVDSAGFTAVASVIVTVGLQVTATANPAGIFAGQASQLIASAAGGTPPYSYQWSPRNSLDNASVATPIAAPISTATYSIIVKDANGQTAMGQVTVTVVASTPAPVITLIAPKCPFTAGACGPSGGIHQVSIGGANFQTGAAVLFGSVPAVNVMVQSSSLIDAVPPPGSGTVDITVINPDGQRTTFPQGLTYIAPLVLTVTATPPVVTTTGTAQLQVSPTGNPPFTFQWASGPALSNLTIVNPVATPSNPPVCCGSTARTSVYNVTVNDSLGQRVSGSVTLTVAGPTLQAGLDQFPADTGLFLNTNTMFDGGRSTGPNPIVLFEWWSNWNPANPSPPDVSGQFLIRPAFNYTVRSPVTVRLRVTDSTGAVSAAASGFVVQ